MVTLTDTTARKSWDYETPERARAVVRLYAVSHPRHTLTVTINGVTYTVYEGR